MFVSRDTIKAAHHPARGGFHHGGVVVGAGRHCRAFLKEQLGAVVHRCLYGAIGVAPTAAKSLCLPAATTVGVPANFGSSFSLRRLATNSFCGGRVQEIRLKTFLRAVTVDHAQAVFRNVDSAHVRVG